MTARIHAYEERRGTAGSNTAFFFVPVPGEPGRYVRVHPAVLHVACGACGSKAGVPCKSISHTQTGRYNSAAHYTRRRDFASVGRGAVNSDVVDPQDGADEVVYEPALQFPALDPWPLDYGPS